MQRDRLAALVALLEFPPFEHLRHVVLGREPDPAETAERFQPFAVEANLRFLCVEDLEDLGLVRLGVALDFISRQRGPGLRPTCRIADERRKRSDDVDDRVAQILEVLHLADEHRVPEMQIGRSRIEPDFHDQRLAGGRESFELDAQLGCANDVDAPFREIGELIVDGHAV